MAFTNLLPTLGASRSTNIRHDEANATLNVLAESNAKWSTVVKQQDRQMHIAYNRFKGTSSYELKSALMPNYHLYVCIYFA